MALIEAVFKRSANNRTMTFQTIAEETRLPRDEVEHLVMKALRYGLGLRLIRACLTSHLFGSLKLIRGNIDQVDERAHIDWVQPRVLSRPQIGALADRLTAWIDRLGNVDSMFKFSLTVPPVFFNPWFVVCSICEVEHPAVLSLMYTGTCTISINILFFP
jgi:26S proteasome regulatory subunit N9